MSLNRSELEANALNQYDSESIHLTELIQPYGCLIGTSLDGEQLLYVSSNSKKFFGSDAQELFRQLPKDLFGLETLHGVRNALSRSAATKQRELVGVFSNDFGSFNVAVHRTSDEHDKDVAIIELTPCDKRLDSHIESLTRLRWLTDQTTGGRFDLPELLNKAVDYLRAISGYDRVKAYRFRPEGSIEVLAESRSNDVQSYLGLRFPAIDISAQARQLYLKTPIRIISDVEIKQSTLLARNENTTLDLSLAILRGTVPVHSQYLKNMGVAGSLSLPIIVDGKLWGLFVFHHMAPKHPTNGMDHVLELAGKFLSLEINAAMDKQASKNIQTCASVANAFASVGHESQVSVATVGPHLKSMGQLIPCSGIAYVSDKLTVCQGSCPQENALTDVIKALQPVEAKIAALDCLYEYVDPKAVGDAAGALCITLEDQSSLVFFRKAVTTEVLWAGSPTNNLNLSDDQTRLSPRASFEVFKQLMEKRCDAWEHDQIAVAKGLQQAIDNAVPAVSAERTATVENLEPLVQELKHRVRNILALVQSIVRQSASLSSHDPAPFSALENRIFALASAHDILLESNSKGINLRDALSREAKPYGTHRVIVSGPPIAFKTDAAPVVVLVFHELFANAAKYGALASDTGQINISWEVEYKALHLIWKETVDGQIVAPTHSGFGLTLIQNALSHELKGRTHMDFHPTGLHVSITLPEQQLTASSAPLAPTVTSPETTNAPFIIGNVLVVENDYMIATETAKKIKSLGALSAFTAGSNEVALKVVNTEYIDLAIVDINLGTERSGPIAQKLRERQIPFIFLSGYDDTEPWLEDYPGVILLRKPVEIEAFKEALELCLLQK